MYTRRLIVVSCATVIALALSGCGGGGGSLSLPDKWQGFESGSPTLRMTGAQIRQAYDSRSQRASHELRKAITVWLQLFESRLPFSVKDEVAVETWLGNYGRGVWSYGHNDRIDLWNSESFDVEVAGVEVDPHDYEGWQLPPGSAVSFAPVLEHNGIPVAQMKARVIHEDEDDGESVLTDIVSYGGWLDHTVFGARFAAACDVDEPECSGTGPVYDWGSVVGLTPFGVYPGTTPTGMGSATWTGVMVGMESPRFENGAAALAWINEGQPDVYLGDARIMIDDLAASDVDVSFTDIRNVTRGTRHHDMSWEGLSVENGLFGGGDFDEFIAGMFTGPRHQEVGGEFRRDGIAGGFGAERQ